MKIYPYTYKSYSLRMTPLICGSPYRNRPNHGVSPFMFLFRKSYREGDEAKKMDGKEGRKKKMDGRRVCHDNFRSRRWMGRYKTFGRANPLHERERSEMPTLVIYS